MISRDRIVLMSRAAAMQKQHAEELGTNSYYRKEYVVSHFLVVWLFVTIVYGSAGLALTMLFVEEWPKEAQNADWQLYLVSFIMIYIIVIFAYVLICLVVYSLRYGKSQQLVKQYNGIIRQLDKVYYDEENLAVQNKTVSAPVKKLKKKVSENRKGDR